MSNQEDYVPFGTGTVEEFVTLVKKELDIFVAEKLKEQKEFPDREGPFVKRDYIDWMREYLSSDMSDELIDELLT